MGFHLTILILIWAIPAIFSVGVIAALFALIRSRPGARQRYRG